MLDRETSVLIASYLPLGTDAHAGTDEEDSRSTSLDFHNHVAALQFVADYAERHGIHRNDPAFRKLDNNSRILWLPGCPSFDDYGHLAVQASHAHKFLLSPIHHDQLDK